MGKAAKQLPLMSSLVTTSMKGSTLAIASKNRVVHCFDDLLQIEDGEGHVELGLNMWDEGRPMAI